MDRLIDGIMDRYMNGCMEGWIQVDKWMSGWMDVDGEKDVWMDR